MKSPETPGQFVSLELNAAVPRGERPRAEPANYFQIANVGADIQLLVGYIDPQIVATKAEQERQRQPSKPVRVNVEVELTHRFLISAQGFALLQKTVETIAKTVGASKLK